MSLPVIKNIVRVRGEVAPDVVVVASADLTGHTATLAIETAAGVAVSTIAGTITAGALSSSISITPDATSVATAYGVGEALYSVILDYGTAALRRTIAEGDWIVKDLAG